MATVNRYLRQPGQIVAYQYRAEQYCPDCLVRVITPSGHNQVIAGTTEAMLDDLADAAGVNREDEYTFDSDEFPKVILSVHVEGDPELDRCGRCGRML